MTNKYQRDCECASIVSDPVDTKRVQASQLIEDQREILTERIHQLLGNSSRKMGNTDEILSTAWRRIDQAIVNGKLDAKSNEQFFAFVHGVIRRTILEKARSGRRMTQREYVAQMLQEDMKKQEPGIESRKLSDLFELGELFQDPVNREIILLKGRGLSFSVIAELMSMESSAVRMRWSRIRKRVREHLDRGNMNEDDESVY